MLKLLLLCLGTSALLILSQNNNPVQRSYWGRTRHFFRDPADIYMVIAIFWMAAFAFLRTNYNDSLLSSKLQKNISEKWRISKNATFSDFIEGSFL